LNLAQHFFSFFAVASLRRWNVCYSDTLHKLRTDVRLLKFARSLKLKTW